MGRTGAERVRAVGLTMSWVRNFLHKNPGNWFFGPVQPAVASLSGAAARQVEPESAYVSLYLEAMRVSAARDRGQAFYGAVTSTCTVETRSGQLAQLVAVSTPAALHGATPARLDRVVTGTVPLIDCVPYRGGVLDAEIGLFAFPGSYLLGPYLDLLGNIATVASAFLPPAGALASAALIPSARKGLDLLFGATAEAKLEIGLAHAWQPPVTGSYAVVAAPEPSEGFRLQQGRSLLNPDGSDVRAAYLILRLDAQPHRHNWASIPDIQASYEVVAAAARRSDLTAAKEALASFRRITLFSPDLLAADAERLHNLVDDQVKRAFPSITTSSRPPSVTFPVLADIPLYER